MKCPKCGGRRFRLIVRYVQDRIYLPDDSIKITDLDDCIGDQANSHWCVVCDEEIKDKDLVREREQMGKKRKQKNKK